MTPEKDALTVENAPATRDGVNKEAFLRENQAATAGAAGAEIIKLFGTIPNLYMTDPGVEAQAKHDEAYQKFMAEVVDIVTKYKVANTDYDWMFSNIENVITSVKITLKNHYANLEKELKSRVLARRNPFDGTYDWMHATHNDMIDAILKVRSEQGNKDEDYFNIVKPKEAEEQANGAQPGATVSPIQPGDLK